jgi:putative FmdB family regulatory protein
VREVKKMPLFNYKCEACSKEFEELVMSLDERVLCPRCKSENVKRQLPNRICGHINSGGGGNPGFT